MCGIMGYTGTKSAERIILDGLYALEYRGYDSAGMAIAGPGGKIVKIKCRGRVSELEKEAAAENCSGSCGIGHTRWATHGAPTKENAHPHSSASLTLVHNGIIDNCLNIREELEKEGYVFVSDTDTECVAHLTDREYKKLGDPAAALYSACARLRGSYALAVIFNDRPNEVYAVRKDNPLILAIAEDGAYAASDIPALLPYSREIIRPGEDEVFCLRRDGAYFVSKNGGYEKRETEHFSLDVGAAGKDGYDFYMLKENIIL